MFFFDIFYKKGLNVFFLGLSACLFLFKKIKKTINILLFFVKKNNKIVLYGVKNCFLHFKSPFFLPKNMLKL